MIARNARREARGEPPLDVDAEVERQLREFGEPSRLSIPRRARDERLRSRSSRLASASGSRLSAMTEAMIPIAKATNTITSVSTGPTL